MRIKKFKSIFIILLILITAIVVISLSRREPSENTAREINPVFGSISTVISSTGTVLPKNRLEIKPPVNGRIERIAVKEGDKVKVGQILAWMSSTERAALLDAARGKGEETLKYWEEAYKPIPLPAPIDGEVIVAKTQPGQTVTTADAAVVLSDHLIVRAQVDETDIGKISVGLKAIITIDAYPETKINAFVEHIYYESKTVSNVTIYEVDLRPDTVPEFFRSGMNASVDFILQGKANALLIPQEAVHKEKDQDFVYVIENNRSQPKATSIKLGISDDQNVEVLSGISENDRILITTKTYSLPKSTSSGTNPFMPQRRR